MEGLYLVEALFQPPVVDVCTIEEPSVIAKKLDEVFNNLLQKCSGKE